MIRKKNDAGKLSTVKPKNNNAENPKNKQSLPAKPSLAKRSREELGGSSSNSASRRTVSSVNTVESIIVCDRGTQCNRDPERPNNSSESSQFVKLLMKDLRELIRDERSEKVISNVERILCKEIEESVILQYRLQTITMKLEASSKRLEETNSTWHKEKELLTSQVNKQNAALREVQQKEEELRSTNKRLHNEIKEAEKLRKSHEKIILQLNKEKEKTSTQLNEEMQSRLITEQYLEIEKEKYQVLSSYKDKLLEELRSSVKELQNNAVEQFASLKDTYKGDDDRERVLLVDNEFTCLSISSKSNDSINSQSLNAESDTSFSEFRRKLGNLDKGHAFIGSSGNDNAASMRLKKMDPELISLPNDVPSISQISRDFSRG